MTEPCAQLEVIGKMKQHMEEGIMFRKKLDSLITIVIVQVIAFAFGYGLQTAKLEALTSVVEAREPKIERMEKHIAVDEARWDIYNVKKELNKEK